MPTLDHADSSRSCHVHDCIVSKQQRKEMTKGRVTHLSSPTTIYTNYKYIFSRHTFRKFRAFALTKRSLILIPLTTHHKRTHKCNDSYTSLPSRQGLERTKVNSTIRNCAPSSKRIVTVSRPINFASMRKSLNWTIKSLYEHTSVNSTLSSRRYTRKANSV